MKFSSILKQIMSYHISYIYQFIFSKQTNYKHVAKTCLRHMKINTDQRGESYFTTNRCGKNVMFMKSHKKDKQKNRQTTWNLSKYQWQPPCLTLNMLKSATLFPSKFFFTKRTSSCFFPAEIGSKSASLWATCCSQCAQKKTVKTLEQCVGSRLQKQHPRLPFPPPAPTAVHHRLVTAG